MSGLQQQAAHMVSGLPDDEKIQAFRRLDAARAEISQYLPDDFDPERELGEARLKRYRHIITVV